MLRLNIRMLTLALSLTCLLSGCSASTPGSSSAVSPVSSASPGEPDPAASGGAISSQDPSEPPEPLEPPEAPIFFSSGTRYVPPPLTLIRTTFPFRT